MDFQTNSSPTVIDPVQFFGMQSVGAFSFRFSVQEFQEEIFCDILSHGVTRDSARSFIHPSPFFSRVFVFRSGGATLQKGDELETLEPGTVYLLPTGMSFNIHYTERELFFFHLRIRDHSGRSIFQQGDPLFQIRNPTLADRLIQAGETGNQLQLEAFLLEMLSEILPAMENTLLERSRASVEFSRIYEYLEKHPAAPITVTELAELYSISAATLSKRFRYRMKVPLKTLLTENLLRQACELLLYSDWPHRKIAEQLGFSDVSYFYRFFHKHTGLTPRDFQHQKRTNRIRI